VFRKLTYNLKRITRIYRAFQKFIIKANTFDLQLKHEPSDTSGLGSRMGFKKLLYSLGDRLEFD
jgi:hypothetical protein